MGRHWMAFHWWIADCCGSRYLRADADRVRFRPNWVRADVADIDVVGAPVAQIRPSKETECRVLVALDPKQCAAPDRRIEVDSATIGEGGVADRCIRLAARKGIKCRRTDG